MPPVYQLEPARGSVSPTSPTEGGSDRRLAFQSRGGSGAALPCWLVERRGRAQMWVTSGKEVGGLVRARPVLNGALIERVVHRLDQRCRDVEF